ncbi:hypothetical protein [Asticcacaulis solisilvae]|uniref:hypothetical protein n=1 Tax=Asticcacaulis solisilvae TaxID=1217274 RepID=UPI003FD83B0B
MKRAIIHGLTSLALLAMAAAFGYFFYVEVTSPPWKDLGLPASVVALIVGGLVYHFAFKDYYNRGATDVQFQVRPPKPAAPSTPAVFMVGATIFMVLFGLYWRHTFHPLERTLLVDTWWPVVLPVATGLTATAWLTDTLFLKIINGAHSGRSPAALRSALVAKRLAVAALAFATVYGLGIWHLADAQDAYRSPLAQAWLASAPALMASLVVIRR